MTEQTPQDETREEKKQRPEPRDAAYWAQRIERLEVSDVPEGAANVNVQGRREVGALQGFGQLWQKTYRVRLAGVEETPEEVVRAWKEHFPEFQPPNSRFYPSMAGVAPGEVLSFSAFRDDDGVTVAQIQSLARANDPIYEMGFRIVGSTQQERIWTHVLKSLAAHFGVNEPVTLEKACVDPKVQWSPTMNIWQNAGARSMLYTITAPLRWRRNKPAR